MSQSLSLAIEYAKSVYDETTNSNPQTVRFCGSYDGQALVHVRNNTLVVAFRGTESWVDWFINLTRYKKKFPYAPGTSVHAGFLKQYEALRAHIYPYVCSHHGNIRNIIITGHSLGGALASMFTLDIAKAFPHAVLTCYAFSSPRVGDTAFVRAITTQPNVTVIRIGMSYDIVTNVPYMGFVHVPITITLETPEHFGVRWYHFKRQHSIRMVAEVCEWYLLQNPDWMAHQLSLQE